MSHRDIRNWTPTVRPYWYALIPALLLLVLALGGAW